MNCAGIAPIPEHKNGMLLADLGLLAKPTG